MVEMEWRTLGERAVKCKGWRWLPGMLMLKEMTGYPGPRFLGFDKKAAVVGVVDALYEIPAGGHEPDLRDPATLGCLLKLVRDAWGKPETFVEYRAGRWEMRQRHIGEDGFAFIGQIYLTDDLGEQAGLGTFENEVEALVAALEAA